MPTITTILVWAYKTTGWLMLASISLSFFLLAIDLEPIATVAAVIGYIFLIVTVGLRFFAR